MKTLKTVRGSKRGSPQRVLGRTIVAGGIASTLVLTAMTGANAAPPKPTDPAAALGQLIQADALTLDLLSTAFSGAGNPSDPGPNSEPINLALLNALKLDVGTLPLPLLNDGTNSGLLDLPI